MTTSTIFIITYVCTTLVFLGIAFRCLGGKKDNFLVTMIISIVVSSVVTSLGLSTWLAIDDSAWEIKTQKSTLEIDSIKINKNKLIYFAKEDKDKKEGVLKNIVKTEKKDSYVEYYREVKSIEALLGKIVLDTKKKTEKILYLNEKDYETYKTSKNNSKK